MYWKLGVMHIFENSLVQNGVLKGDFIAALSHQLTNFLLFLLVVTPTKFIASLALNDFVQILINHAYNLVCLFDTLRQRRLFKTLYSLHIGQVFFNMAFFLKFFINFLLFYRNGPGVMVVMVMIMVVMVSIKFVISIIVIMMAARWTLFRNFEFGDNDPPLAFHRPLIRDIDFVY